MIRYRATICATKGSDMPVQDRGTIVACLALMLMADAATPQPSEVQEVSPEQALPVLGQNVADAQGKVMGRLVDVLVTVDGNPEAAVIDFGGFMGVGSRKIAVRWSALHFAPADKKNPVTLELTLDQIKAAPEYKDLAKPAPVVVAPASQPVSAAPKPPTSSQ